MFLRPRRRTSPIPIDPWNRVRVGLGLLSVIMTVGFIGYRILGLASFDALYQTAITVTTVGFGEVGTPEQIDREYRAFTMLLAFFGVGGALYTLGVMVEAYVEGSINDGFRIRKEQRMINKMAGHIVVIGAGRVGNAITHYVSRHGADVVVVDRQTRSLNGPTTITGEATDDETLRRAGIARASTLIAALDSDADNVYVTLSARSLNPGLFIVARTNSQSNEAKFFQAGADRVVNPHEIGGSRMGALALHPTLAEFLDQVLHDESHGVRVDEIEIPEGSPHVGKPLRSLVGNTGQPLVIAVRDQNHGYVAAPGGDMAIIADAVLIVLGADADVDALYRRVSG